MEFRRRQTSRSEWSRQFNLPVGAHKPLYDIVEGWIFCMGGHHKTDDKTYTYTKTTSAGALGTRMDQHAPPCSQATS